MRLKFLFLSLFALLMCSAGTPAVAETTVTASVDRNSLDPEDTFTLTLTISSSEQVSAGEPNWPNLSEFTPLNEWQTQESRATFVTTQRGPEFRTVRSVHYHIMLQPKRQGNLTIGASEIEVGGKKYHTKPITLRVAPGAGAQRPKPGGPRGRPQFPPGGVQPPPGLFDEEDIDLFQQLLRRQAPPQGGSRTMPVNPDEAFFVQVEVDKTEAFVGEQVTASWYLYTRGVIRDLDTLKYPSLRGFWKEDIEIATHLNFVQEVVNGIPYRKALLASFALFPIKEGTATIDPYTAKCTVIPAVDALGALGMGKPYVFTKASKPVKINVKPLPTEGRPPEFTGAVGDFQVSARVEDKSIMEGQPFTYKLRFEGKGNAKLVEVPALELPEGLELYDKQNEARFFRTGTSFKDFNFLLIPRRQGEFVLPPVSAAVFDPEKKVYVKKASEPVRVIVGKGQGGVKTGPDVGLGERATGKPDAKAGPAEPQLMTEFRPSRPVPRAMRVMLWSLVFAAVLGILLWRARLELGWGQKKKDLLRQLKARMRRVEAKLQKNDWRGVGTEMTNTVYFVLGEISGEGGANVELEKLFMKSPPSVRREIEAPLKKQMETFQVLSFAPEQAVGALKDPAEMRKAVSAMEKLMEQAVALGVSAGQSSGSVSDPTTS